MKSRQPNFSKFLTLSFGLTVAAMALQSAHAANGSWTGLGADSNWSTSLNWTGATPPGTGGQIATFNGAGNGKTTIGLGAGISVSNIVFDTASAAAYTIGSGGVGAQNLTLNTNITLNSAVVSNQLFNANVLLNTGTGSHTFSNNSTTIALTFAGTVSDNLTGLTTLNTAVAAGGMTISGSITNGLGQIAISKSGTGTLTLSGASTAITGGLSIGGGVVTISGGSSGLDAISYTAANTTLNVNNGAALVTSGITTTGNSNSRTLNINGTLTASGNIFASGNAGVVAFNGGTLASGNAGGITISDENNSIGVSSGGATLDTTTGNITSTATFSGAGPITAQGGNTFFSAASTTGLFTISGSSKWDLNNVTSSVGGLSGSGTILNSGASSQTLTATFTTAVGPFTFSGNIAPTTTNRIALTKSGNGTQILTGTNTYAGATTITSGTLQLGDATTTGSISASSAISIASGANLTFKRSNSVTQGTDFSSTDITGAGSLTQAGSNTLTLNTSNSYSGGTTITSGAITATSSGALGTGTVTNSARLQLSNNITLANTINLAGQSNAAITSAGRIENVSGTNAINGNITFNNVGGTYTGITSTTGTLTLGGNLTATVVTGNRFFSFAGAGDIGSTGIISDGSATVGVQKDGAGTLTLSGPNTYNGATTVAAGKLLVTDSIGNSAVTVSTGGTILASDAAATIGSSVTVNAGAILAAGDVNSVGNATVGGGGLDLKTNSIFDWDLTTNDSVSGFDTVATSNNGNLTVASGAIFKVVLGGAVDGSDPFWTSGTQSWNVFSVNGTGTTTEAVSGHLFDTIQVVDATTGSLFTGVNGSFSFTGSTLTWTAVPEPTSALAGLLLVAGLLRRRVSK
jgi:fibronectin-binding autotransporter adhesin